MANKDTRIQREKREIILDAALQVFSENGFRGATLDQIAGVAGLSKPNMLYYFSGKEAIYTTLLNRLLETWLQPLENIDSEGDPHAEIMGYICAKLEFSRKFPRESRLFAIEILNGAPRLSGELDGSLKNLVDRSVGIFRKWMSEGQLAKVDPYHLIFSIWATTQHYADFAVQMRSVLGDQDPDPITTGSEFLEALFFKGLDPR
ncbi:MAG: TetR family transcriptional regulator [Rhodobacteraceae bacterium]|nr:MAG: TetR family transcriptional regulator [Paracoccaceae bacterium]